jgi:hypothetical protein
MAALLKAASEAVAAATVAKFPTDELLGVELSRLISVANSIVKRHGTLLERAVVEALEASGRFQVLRNAVVPITGAADSAIASNSPEALARVALRYDVPAVRSVSLDLIVIDTASAWAGGYQIKRGGGELGPRIRRPLERDLAAVRLLLRSYVRDQGYVAVDRVTSATIDWVGLAGFPEHLTVRGPELDDHFGVPVVRVIEQMTDHLRVELHKTVPDLLRPLLAVLEMQAVSTRSRQKSTTKESAGEELIGEPDFLSDVGVDFPARPMGPGPRHPAPQLLVVPRPPQRPTSGPLF